MGERRALRPLLLSLLLAGVLVSCTSSSTPGARTSPSARPPEAPSALPSVVASVSPHEGFAIWPEDTPQAAARTAVGLEQGDDPWRTDASETAVEFSQRVLEWPHPSTGAVKDLGYGSFAVEVTRESGGPSVSVRVAKLIADRWWSVTYVQGDPPEGYTATVRGSKVELGFDDDGAASMDVRVGYGGQGVSRTVTRPGLKADLGFEPTTTGHFLVLYRNEHGEVFSAFGTKLPAGDFAAG